ncbi:MAG: Na+/H+ antiporter NhaA [Flavobacteriales bacterium]|nr:Na+/H+ antiporter NhaA [Flavobacteriales bacterium]
MLTQFFKRPSSPGILLIISTILALVLANSPWSEHYFSFMQMNFTVGMVEGVNITHSVEHWINDGLMAIFFLLIGLEIKSELKFGELNSVKSALFPTVTAIGGAIIPAAIFMMINMGTENVNGWAIPMATDIAFVIGIISLIGSRIPIWVKVFITTVAVVDDLIAIAVIAVFYTNDINFVALLIAAFLVLLLVFFNLKKTNHLLPYMIVGGLLWWAIMASGVHATLAGVILALTIPLNRDWSKEEITERARRNYDFYMLAKDGGSGVTMKDAHIKLEKTKRQIESPLKRLERKLHNPVYFLIMPLFAFVNAGIVLDGGVLTSAFDSTITLGIFLGLFLGKPLGILLGFWLIYKLTRTKNSPKPVNLWTTILGVGFLGGIGFTMSFFIGNLSYSEGESLDYAKVGILSASLLGTLLGFYFLRYRIKRFDDDGF